MQVESRQHLAVTNNATVQVSRSGRKPLRSCNVMGVRAESREGALLTCKLPCPLEAVELLREPDGWFTQQPANNRATVS